MQRNSLLLVALLSVVVNGQHPGTMLHKHNLPGEKSICNDGTRATYYTQDGLASGSVVIGLQVLFWKVFRCVSISRNCYCGMFSESYDQQHTDFNFQSVPCIF